MRLSRLDALLLLMVLIWGTNYSIIKSALRQIDEQAFNALRLAIASTIMMSVSLVVRRTRRPAWAWSSSVFQTPAPLTRRDWLALLGLGLVGHCTYQYLFIGGLARTSVANSALVISLSPALITLLTVAVARERVGVRHWIGTALSVAGIYIVIGHDVRIGAGSIAGDLMMLGAVVCWAVYTIGSRPLMVRHSPVGVTAFSMLLGTLIYVPLMASHLMGVRWGAVTPATWAKLVYSACFALSVSYTIWYAAVRAIGSARTSVYSNLLPIIAMITAAAWLHEPIGRAKMAGAAAVLIGVGLTRLVPARETIK
ncbi:MAG TPA: DMT family transporter [Vicinamibacterales bacterium]